LLGAANDITELKATQDKLKKLSDELARSNTEFEMFAYEASHDLQAPLGMVINYLRLLADKYHNQLDAGALDFVAAAEEGVQWMQTLIKDLLAYSKVDTQDQPFRRVDCQDVLARTLANLKITLEAQSAEITHDALPVVFADEAQMVQVFQNLIANAVTFNTANPPRVHLSAKLSGKSWLFAVKDNGLGIAPRDARKIFKAFTRLPNGKKYQGTGMGLTICKKIVERHGGKIWVESQPGKGSIFYFSLPRDATIPGARQDLAVKPD
jgi:light-regulated signal transduction histidine kinase (bacteriophytochrome)